MLVLALGVLGLVVPLLIARHTGAYGIPRGDDWSYLQTLFRWVDHGRLDGNHWVSMTLIGQVAVAAPVVAIFGRDIGAVQVTAAVMGLIGLVSTYWLGRQIVGRGAGAFIALSMAVGPLWGVLVISFMTDVPDVRRVDVGVGAGRCRDPSVTDVDGSPGRRLVRRGLRIFDPAIRDRPGDRDRGDRVGRGARRSAASAYCRWRSVSPRWRCASWSTDCGARSPTSRPTFRRFPTVTASR